jgi:putative tryptophan/tyrosine transport system substrate-binding protein
VNGVLLALLLAAVGLLACAGSEVEAPPTTETTAVDTGPAEEDERPLVGIVQIVTHPALEAVVGGFQQELAELGYREGESIDYRILNAGGDQGRAGELGRRLAEEGAEVIIAVSRPAAEAVVERVDEVPVIFSAVSSPAAAGVPRDRRNVHENVTGVTDLPPIDRHLDLVDRLVPDAGRLGLLYDTSDPVSVGIAHREAAAARERGYEVLQTGAGEPGGVLAAAQTLAGQVDAISIMSGSPILAALESVLAVAHENQIPVVGNDSDSVRRGVLAAYSVGYEEHGRQVGRLAARILQGADPVDLPIEDPEVLELSLNTTSARGVGLTFPDDLRTQADRVY